MIYKFRIISDENPAFARELLIDSTQTFLDFHQCLQENLAYDPAQLSSFFITSASWEKQLQITLIDMMDDASDNCTTMDRCEIGEHFSEKGQRMLYVFDFFSERSFFIELTEVMDVSDSKALPKVIFSHGDPPPQINLGLDDLMISEDDFNDGFGEDMTDDAFDDDIDFMDTDDFPDD